MTRNSAAFGGLLASWERSLRAAAKSERTIDSYLETAVQFAGFLDRPVELRDVTTADIENYIIHLLDTRSPATARLRYASLKQLFRWATAEHEVDVNPMANIGPPAQPTREVPVLNDDELKALTASLTGSTFEERRDAAVVWTLLSTGIRVGELIGMSTDSVDLDRRSITVIGKGDRERTVAIGDQTILAIDRYERMRRRHPRAMLDAFWLGPKGPLTDSGVRQLVKRRGAAAGVVGLNPHRFRHTFAHRWLAKGGTEQGLQTAAGWRSPQMLQRYGASAKSERAREEAARLGMEDL